MALSGNLANFAGGLIILLFKPFKVGDYIEAQGTGGTVKEIQIFHTILATPDNKMVYIPNGSLSSGAVTNFSRQTTRRVDWTFGVDYGEDYDKVKAVIETIIARDSRILTDPAPFIALHALADSSVNIVVLYGWKVRIIGKFILASIKRFMQHLMKKASTSRFRNLLCIGLITDLS